MILERGAYKYLYYFKMVAVRPLYRSHFIRATKLETSSPLHYFIENGIQAYNPLQKTMGRMHERKLSLNPSLVPDLVLPTTFFVCTKAD